MVFSGHNYLSLYNGSHLLRNFLANATFLQTRELCLQILENVILCLQSDGVKRQANKAESIDWEVAFIANGDILHFLILQTQFFVTAERLEREREGGGEVVCVPLRQQRSGIRYFFFPPCGTHGGFKFRSSGLAASIFTL